MAERIHYTKRTKKVLGLTVYGIPNEANRNIACFEGSKLKVFINYGGIEIHDFREFIKQNSEIAYCLFGNNLRDEPSEAWYWASLHEWKKIYNEYIKENPLPENGTDHTKITKFADSHGFTKLEPQKSNDQAKQAFIQRIKEDLGMDRLEEQLEKLINAGVRQIICHGAPGTGKTYTIQKLLKDNKYEKIDGNFVQFHPSYDYTDFVEGLRPVCLGENEAPTFVRMDGIFKKFCREVYNKGETDKKYIFIIDEINRADLSKVFGELMYCLEEGYRGEENGVVTQYANLPCYEIVDGIAKPIANDVFQDKFFIPENVIILGTMNDIDRSVESFDFAMQRRFHWINVDADTEMTTEVLTKIFEEDLKASGKEEQCGDNLHPLAENLAKELRERAIKLNSIIEKNLSVEYKIGHAYYKKFAGYCVVAAPKDPGTNKIITTNDTSGNVTVDNDTFNTAYEQVWKYSLEPILTSYLRGRKNKSLEDYRTGFGLGVKANGLSGITG